MPPDHDDLADIYRSAVLAIHAAYARFAYSPQHNQWTILASFFLTRHRSATGVTPSAIEDNSPEDMKIISLATGTKCLPASRLSLRGEAVHDCHAEVLARRAALRWFLEETGRLYSSDQYRSPWLVRRLDDGKTALCPGVQLHLYISTIPCGDASMRYLAALQDPAIAALKDAHRLPTSTASPLPSPISTPASTPSAAARGRDDYLLLGVLRTKPGRADSPPTRCMACSDKIARWAVLGVQGALGARVLTPMYVSGVVVGVQEVQDELRDVVRKDCERAFSGRIGALEGLPKGYALHAPEIHFSDVPFVHARSVLGSSTSCNESLCWLADSDGGSQPEILINGLRRGVSPKHRYREKSRSAVSRITLFNLATQVHALFAPVSSTADASGSGNMENTYLQAKRSSNAYQVAKRRLVGPGGPFAGWVETGEEWQMFDVGGEVVGVSDEEWRGDEVQCG